MISALIMVMLCVPCKAKSDPGEPHALNYRFQHARWRLKNHRGGVHTSWRMRFDSNPAFTIKIAGPVHSLWLVLLVHIQSWLNAFSAAAARMLVRFLSAGIMSAAHFPVALTPLESRQTHFSAT
jgi:hypothetical protein